MKHLRKFNESRKAISEEDIKDICLEFEDIGMKMRFYNHEDKGSYLSAVTDNGVTVKWKDIKDICLRLKEYLGENFIQFSFDIPSYSDPRFGGSFIKVTLDEEIEMSVGIKSICIWYWPK